MAIFTLIGQPLLFFVFLEGERLVDVELLFTGDRFGVATMQKYKYTLALQYKTPLHSLLGGLNLNLITMGLSEETALCITNIAM